jgi:GDPmannose 4,6-dehydratase
VPGSPKIRGVVRLQKVSLLAVVRPSTNWALGFKSRSKVREKIRGWTKCMPRALITGVTGQDGAYLSRLLLKNGYQVFGLHRRTSSNDFWRLSELGVVESERFKFIEHDLTDFSSTSRILKETKPDEIYNLAAQSFVGTSFQQPQTTAQITGLGALNLLEGIRDVNPQIKYYQASTSEMFGMVQQVPQTEETPFYPRSPYGVAKLFAHWMTINYRESYGIFGASGILFNHESPLRGKEFVTRKITDAVARIKLGANEVLELGNLDAKRDWGFAEEYVEGMWRMLQADRPSTYVLATNKTTSVRDFVSMAFAAADIDVVFDGEGVSERAVDGKTGREVMRVSPAFYRPAEVDLLLGDPAKAKQELGWEPTTSVEDLCSMMVRADIDRQKRGLGR